jgi:hypothetical protein
MARVNSVGHDKCILCGIKRIDTPERDVALFEDEVYAVGWHPSGGYAFYRKKDRVWMTSSTWPTPESAKVELFRTMYQPQQTSGAVIG